MSDNIETTNHNEHSAAEPTHSIVEGSSRGRIIGFFISALVIVAALVVGLLFFTGTLGSNAQDDDPQVTGPLTDGNGEDEPNGDEDSNGNNNDPGEKVPELQEVLPEDMNGQEAIDALGDNIDAVAERNGKTVEELKQLLLRDNTVYVTKTGHIMYRDTMTPRN